MGLCACSIHHVGKLASLPSQGQPFMSGLKLLNLTVHKPVIIFRFLSWNILLLLVCFQGGDCIGTLELKLFICSGFTFSVKLISHAPRSAYSLFSFTFVGNCNSEIKYLITKKSQGK